jgi:hypothetical protein
MELPGCAQEIADVIGRENALYLIGQLPRSSSRSWRVVLYVPKRLPADHELVKLLGWETADKLRRHFGGEILQPSNCNIVYRRARNTNARRMAAEGMPIPQIADILDLTPRQVRNILAETPPEEITAHNDNLAETNSDRGATCQGK